MELEIKRSNLEQKFFELTEKIVHENNYALYDVEYHSGSSTLRVFIMDPETKTAVIEDCVKVDRAFDPLFTFFKKDSEIYLKENQTSGPNTKSGKVKKGEIDILIE